MPEQSQDTPQPEAPPEAAVQSGLIDFAEPAAEHDPNKVAAILTVEEVAQDKVQSAPTPVEPPVRKPVDLSPDELAQLQLQAGSEDMKRDFYHRVMEARKPPEEPAKPAPAAPRIVEQTNAEMAAGRALVEKNERIQALRRPVQPDPTDGKTTSVFRPEDYVPNQRKGQGNVQARNL